MSTLSTDEIRRQGRLSPEELKFYESSRQGDMIHIYFYIGTDEDEFDVLADINMLEIDYLVKLINIYPVRRDSTLIGYDVIFEKQG